MTESSRFWSGRVADGASGDAGPYTMDQFSAVFAMMMGNRRGVLHGLAVTESAPAGKSVTVTVGGAIIDGIFYECDEAVELAISDNTSGSPRIDMAVLECDWSGANAQTIRVKIVEGTPAASPEVPTLTRNSGVLWQEPLAAVAVADGFTSILTANIEDWRKVIHPGKYAGQIEPCLTTNVPDGALLLDGRAVNRTRYADLFSAYGTTYGAGDGSTTFNLPDMRGRVIAGLDDMGTDEGAANEVTDSSADSQGGTIGEDTHTLTVAEMPAHTHGYTSSSFGQASGSGSVGTVCGSATGRTTTSTGSGNAYNIMQPTLFSYWICWA